MPRKPLLFAIALVVCAGLVAIFRSFDSFGAGKAPAAKARELEPNTLASAQLAAPTTEASPQSTDNPIEASAIDLLQKAPEFLPSLPGHERAAYVSKLIQRLRAAGTPGLHAVAAFLRDGRDAPIYSGWVTQGGRITQASSLRIALLEALADWEGALQVNLQALGATKSVWEAIIVTRNLELAFPGTYRPQAIAALQAKLAGPEPLNVTDGSKDFLFMTAAHLQAIELLPFLEKLALQDAGLLGYFMEFLNALPEDARLPALKRIFAQTAVRNQIEKTPWAVTQLSFRDPRVQAFALELFATELSPKQQMQMIETFRPAQFGMPLLFTRANQQREAEQARSRVAWEEARGRKAFLENVRASLEAMPPQPSTAAMKKALAEAQKSVTTDLARRAAEIRLEPAPVAEIDFADGTGKAQIKGRRIEHIELDSPDVILQAVPVEEDSTPEPAR